MRKLLVALWAAMALIPAPVNASEETARLNAWLDRQYEQELQRSPLTLTMYGRKEAYDRVDDFSLAAAEAELAWLAQSGAAMAAEFNYAELSPDGRASYDFWRFRAERAAARRPWLHHAYVFTQFYGTHTYPAEFLLNYHVVDTPSDMRAYIARVRGFARALGQALDRAAAAADRGIRAPGFAYDFVIAESRNVISGAPFDDSDSRSPIWEDGLAKVALLHERNDISDENARALREQLKKALLESLLPAYTKLIRWHEEDRVNTDTLPRGVSALPRGDDYYRERLAYYTHSEMSPEDVHQLGLGEVSRIQEEMRGVMEQVGYRGELQDFLARVRDDADFYYPDTDAGRSAYLARTRQLLEAMNNRLPDWFGTLPRSPLLVRRVEAYREQPGAAQFYQQGTADGSRPGVYYVHLADMNAYNRTDLETTAYHEGSPGHHMQLSLAMERDDLPAFRRNEGYSAFYEGWALYAEYLAREMGAFEDPYDDFGRLVAEIWRAIRLVVDTGLHAKGWSEAQAVAYMLQNSAIPEPAVRSEIQRYLVAPGQATSYKVGMLKILELRARAARELGDGFDIRAFHDTVLAGGSMPLPVLEQVVNDWIAATLERVASD